MYDASPNLICLFDFYSMGAKVQTENTKLVVPGAGSYEYKSNVSSFLATHFVNPFSFLLFSTCFVFLFLTYILKNALIAGINFNSHVFRLFSVHCRS